jgi:tetratricopeptide (TPR) repeat protein
MKFASKILLLLCMAALFAVPGFAQTGNIKGKVTGLDGKPMVGVTIAIDRKAINQHFEIKTDAKGAYLHAGLPTGQYKVTLMQDGKAVTFLDNVRVTFGGDAEANFDMKELQANAGSADERAKAEAVKAGFDQGLAALNAKNYAEAARLFQEAADKDQTQPNIYGQLGLALNGARKYDDAAVAFRKAIELKPDPAYYDNLGIALGSSGKVDEAMQAFQKAAELNPATGAQSWFNAGAVLTNRGKVKEASEAFKKAIELDPMMAQAYYQLGISYFGAPDTIAQAIPALEKFLQMAPTDPNAEAAKQLIEAAKQSAPTGFKSEKAIAEEKAAAEKAENAKADAEKEKAKTKR